MQETRTTKRIAVAALSALLAGVFAGPVGAQDTEDKLDDAKAQLAKVEREANAATAEYEAARGRFITTQGEIRATRARVRKVSKRVDRLQLRLGERASDAYKLGGAGVLDLLFVSDSLSDFSDRVVFLDRIAQADTDLMLRADVLIEELGRHRVDLQGLLEEQKGIMKILDKKRAAIYSKLEEAQVLRDKLADKLARERAAARAVARAVGSTAVIPGAALQACPAPGTSYVDSWGAPRSGGRTHQGVDMMGPRGAPVYAAQAGRVTHSSSSLGGMQAYVYGNSGDMTFYAHLSGYAGGQRSVAAGEQIGYIGDTGNARGSPHLHFEYHPGGGGAVNPYPYVQAVC